MKNRTVFTFVVMATIYFMSCKSGPTKEKQTNLDSPDPNHASIQEILKPASVAIPNIRYFDNVIIPQDPILKSHPIRGFTIRALDLFLALGIDSAKSAQLTYDSINHIRVYLGYDESSDTAKIYLVPVEGADQDNKTAGTDLFLDSSGKIIIDNPAASKFVLDLTTPCPSMCDVTSLLNREK